MKCVLATMAIVLTGVSSLTGCGLIDHDRAYKVDCLGRVLTAVDEGIGSSYVLINGQRVNAISEGVETEKGRATVFEFRDDDEDARLTVSPLTRDLDAAPVAGRVFFESHTMLAYPNSGREPERCILVSSAIS